MTRTNHDKGLFLSLNMENENERQEHEKYKIYIQHNFIMKT